MTSSSRPVGPAPIPWSTVPSSIAIERHPILTITLRIISLIFYGIGALGLWIGNWFEERCAEMKKR